MFHPNTMTTNVVTCVYAEVHNLKNIDTSNLFFSCQFGSIKEVISYDDNYHKIIDSLNEVQIIPMYRMMEICGNDDCVNYIPIKFDIPRKYANIIPTFEANVPNFTFYYNLATYDRDDHLISIECIKQTF